MANPAPIPPINDGFDNTDEDDDIASWFLLFSNSSTLPDDTSVWFVRLFIDELTKL